jgi:hypothetical protein
MPRPFFPSIAEQVVQAIEAVVVSGARADADVVSLFCDIPKGQAEAALHLAVDLGLLVQHGGNFQTVGPLCRFLVTPNPAQRAAVIRVALESYEPFIVFRQRLEATDDASLAAQQTKHLLDLDKHREQVKETLVSLGTYSDALVTERGGRVAPQPASAPNAIQVLGLSAGDHAAAQGLIRTQIGVEAARTVSHTEVIAPLASALIKANNGDARGAVVEAGNAVESYLAALAATPPAVALTGATGINSKLEKFHQARRLPGKLVFVGKHLGHVRNAADHGVDAEIGTSWSSRSATGLEYVFLACSFIAAVTAKELGTFEI